MRIAVLFLALAAPVEGAPLKVALAVHGGTGVPRTELSAEKEQAVRADLAEALKAGLAKLRSPGGGLDAIEAAIRVLEDSPHFNAGKGAVFTREGKNELDASLMEGKELKAGAVAGVTRVKNPIRAARAVMEKSPHVMLIGAGADAFAEESGLEMVDPSYFRTEHRWQQLQEFLKRKSEVPPQRVWGTVGAVAVDTQGNLFAGTSTGGMTGKRPGRVGDSPIIGAGTYADNKGCAVSATGHGEYFIRFHVASDINDLMRYKKLPIAKAAEEVVLRKVAPAGGEGGVIALDAKGNFAAPFKSDGLYRGTITSDGAIDIRLY